jgi:TonB family protein
MKNPHFKDEHFFTLALLLSVAVHGGLFAATGIMPSRPEVSVIDAPNSLEINMIKQPFVSVIEEEIITEEIIEEEGLEEIVFKNPTKEVKPRNVIQPPAPSQESRGAITKAKPLIQVNPAPIYPKLARQRGWEGTVKLTALIEKDGTANQVGIAESSGYGILDNAAVNTVKTWKFSPAQSGPIQFSSRISIPIRFDLIKE